MKYTYPGKDVIKVDETTDLNIYTSLPKIHLIKLAFSDPNEEKVKDVLDKFPNTNRFIVDTDIRIYNTILKYTSKKYYVQNTEADNNNFISFFRKNNKCLVDFTKFSPEIREFAEKVIFVDILKNTEVILTEADLLDSELFTLSPARYWKGNVIVKDDAYPI